MTVYCVTSPGFCDRAACCMDGVRPGGQPTTTEIIERRAREALAEQQLREAKAYRTTSRWTDHLIAVGIMLLVVAVASAHVLFFVAFKDSLLGVLALPGMWFIGLGYYYCLNSVREMRRNFTNLT